MRFTAKLLAIFALSTSAAFADFIAGPSNTIFPGAITPGYTDVATNGAIRWNPTTSRHQAFNGTNWVDVGTGAAGLQPVGFLPYAYIQSDATGGYGHVYGPRMPTNRSEALFLYATNALADMWPGQLMRNDMVGTVNEGNVYILSQPLYITNFAPHTTNYFPWAGEPTATNYWNLFVERGRTGSIGLPGTDGADGIGNARISVWSAFYEYDYNTNSLHLVLDNGRLYLNTTGSTGRQPSAVGGSNYWVVAVDKGMSGGLDPTNLVLRHEWDASSVYTNNDAVTYYGNLFYKGTGVTHFAPGVPPSINNATEMIGVSTTNWTVLVSRGARGAMGPDGNVVNSFTYYYHYDIITTNSPTNTASSSHRLLAWAGTNAGGTNIYAWVDYLPVGTNVISVSGTNLLLNGAVFAPGGGVAPADAPTNYFVRLAGETNGVDLTNTTVKIRDAVSPNEPATLGQLQAGTAAAVTNAVDSVTLNGTNYVGLSEVIISDPYLRGSAAGGTLTVARILSGVTFTTNSYGIVGHTNAYGVFIPVAGSMYPPGTPYIARTFEAPYTLTNFNQGNWSAIITNGTLVVTADSNSVTQVRIFGNEPLPAASPVGVCVRLKSSPVLRDASDHYYFGLAGGLATNSNYYGINIVANNGEGTVNGQNGTPGGGISTSTGNESATMLANLNRILSLINIDGRRIWLVFDWNPSTRLLRQGVARDNDGVPFYPYQLQGTTNFSSDITQAGIWLTQRTISKVPMQWVFDDFLIYTNLMW